MKIFNMKKNYFGYMNTLLPCLGLMVARLSNSANLNRSSLCHSSQPKYIPQTTQGNMYESNFACGVIIFGVSVTVQGDCAEIIQHLPGVSSMTFLPSYPSLPSGPSLYTLWDIISNIRIPYNINSYIAVPEFRSGIDFTERSIGAS